MEELLAMTKRLRSPKGCPWDRAQTFESLAKFALEEGAELADALRTGEWTDIQDELADVLFQVLINSEIASESDLFDFKSVCLHLQEKLRRRHPHVFDPVLSQRDWSLEEVERAWIEIKEAEKSSSPGSPSVSFNPKIPSLLNAEELGSYSTKVNFDWSAPIEVFKKVKEEIAELEEAVQAERPDQTHIEEELGDLLFTVAQLSRHLGLSSELALKRANRKFANRLQKLLELSGDKLNSLSPEEKESLWERVKNHLD